PGWMIQAARTMRRSRWCGSGPAAPPGWCRAGCCRRPPRPRDMTLATRALSDSDVPTEAVEGPAPDVRRLSIASDSMQTRTGLEGHRSPSRIDDVLRELDCDIYALQEVDNEPGDEEDSQQLEYLSEAMDMAAIPGLRIVRHSGEY